LQLTRIPRPVRHTVAVSAALALVAMPLGSRAAQAPDETRQLSQYVRGDDPAPPTEAEIEAAAAAVSQRAGALQRQEDQLSTANTRLTGLENQAEILTERYDQAVLDEQQATTAYRQAQNRLRIADAAERQADQQAAAQAAADFESAGGVSQASAMFGDSAGPQQFLDVASLENLLAQHSSEVVGARRADEVVDGVFRQQARDLLVAKQADVRAVSDLKVAVQAAVARQQSAVTAAADRRNALAGQLAGARAHQAALQAAQQAAARAAAAEAAAEQAATERASDQQSVAQQASDQLGAPETGTQWALSSGASADQGDIAANWALSQLGKPYQWGGAGPDSYDCSGLAMRAWARAGVQLGHWTGWQWVSGPHVPLDQLHRGDLLFYATNTSDPSTIHHVGIYIGDGMMVDAPYTGAFVRIDSMYQPGGLIGATRPAA
jgi:cell wall-associated NlpC family hydrolase